MGSIMSIQRVKFEAPPLDVTSATAAVPPAARAATWRPKPMSPSLEHTDPNLQVVAAMIACATFLLPAPLFWWPPLTVMALMGGD
jgi:hypothetical protein